MEISDSEQYFHGLGSDAVLPMRLVLDGSRGSLDTCGDGAISTLNCIDEKRRTSAVLNIFILQLNNSSVTFTAAQETISQLEKVWTHHFSSRVIHGYDQDMQENTKKMIMEDFNIRRKVLKLLKQWKDMERTSWG